MHFFYLITLEISQVFPSIISTVVNQRVFSSAKWCGDNGSGTWRFKMKKLSLSLLHAHSYVCILILGAVGGMPVITFIDIIFIYGQGFPYT